MQREKVAMSRLVGVEARRRGVVLSMLCLRGGLVLVLGA